MGVAVNQFPLLWEAESKPRLMSDWGLIRALLKPVATLAECAQEGHFLDVRNERKVLSSLIKALYKHVCRNCHIELSKKKIKTRCHS